jgi:hypothetical protein
MKIFVPKSDDVKELFTSNFSNLQIYIVERVAFCTPRQIKDDAEGKYAALLEKLERKEEFGRHKSRQTSNIKNIFNQNISKQDAEQGELVSLLLFNFSKYGK